MFPSIVQLISFFKKLFAHLSKITQAKRSPLNIPSADGVIDYFASQNTPDCVSDTVQFVVKVIEVLLDAFFFRCSNRSHHPSY